MAIREWFEMPQELVDLVSRTRKKLRESSADELASLKDGGSDIEIRNERGSLWIYVERHHDGSVRVIVQGTLSHSWLPFRGVHVDGFEKCKDGTTRDLRADEMYEYD